MEKIVGEKCSNFHTMLLAKTCVKYFCARHTAHTHFLQQKLIFRILTWSSFSPTILKTPVRIFVQKNLVKQVLKPWRHFMSKILPIMKSCSLSSRIKTNQPSLVTQNPFVINYCSSSLHFFRLR